MPDIEHWIDRCCRQLNRGAVLKVVAEWMAVWFCGFGTLLLAAKFGWPIFWPHAAWLGLTAIPVLFLAIRRGMRNRYSRVEGAALLDGTLHAGGLLMAVSERQDGEWRRWLPADEVVWNEALPKLRPVRFARLLALPVAFALVALLLPPRPTPTKAAGPHKPLPAVDELPQMLEELKQADVLDPAEYEFLSEEISKVVKSTEKSPPTPEHWRKIDALRTRMTNRLEEHVRVLEKGRQAANKLAAAAEPGAPPLTAEQRRQFQKDLEEALKRLPRGNRPASGKRRAGRPDAVAAKTGARKTGAPQKTPVPAKTGIKVAAGKTGAQRKGTKVPGKTFPKVAGKTTSKQPGAKPPKTPGGPQPKSPFKLPQLDNLPDLELAMKMFGKLPPEMQDQLMRQAMRMLQQGGVELPKDPETQRRLMEQARKLLTTHRDELEKLRRQFEQMAGNTDLVRRFPLPKEGSNGGVNPGGNPQAGSKTGQDGNPPPKRSAVSFRDVVLPPGLLDKARRQTDDVTGKAPAVKPFQPTTPGKKTAGDTTANPQWRALQRKVRPRHRGLVYRYFFEKREKP